MILEQVPNGRHIQDACFLQAAVMEAGDGDYVETGVFRGESLLFVTLVKRLLGLGGRAIGIEVDASKREKIEETFALYDLEPDVIYQSSFPWPLPDLRPVVAYIDGDHSFEMAKNDWESLSPITQKFIVCHDYGAHEGATRMIDEIAKKDPDWRFVGLSRYTVVFERGGNYIGRVLPWVD